MAPAKVFIDGHAGTTGLRLRELLVARDDIVLIAPPEAQRKNPAARRECMAEADAMVLCLPDDAAREAVALAEGLDLAIIDASTAHRVAEGWLYGLPELEPAQRVALARATRVTNPGCYPTGVVLLLRPLIEAGLLAPTAPVTIHALSGYSGGGRPMIERWEDPAVGLIGLPFEAPYALDKRHKHIAEMVRYGRLENQPQFVPAVGPFRCGMRIEIPLHVTLLREGVNARILHGCLADRYADEGFIELAPWQGTFETDESTLDPRALNDTNSIRLAVASHPDGHALLVAVLDNLGKGAAGAAVQNLNLILGCPEAQGLRRHAAKAA